jgi:flagellar motility protein MotE (MotC chaperone)
MKGAVKHYNPQAPTRAELDIMKEKAETLGRTGAKLEQSLRRLRTLQEHIRILEKEGKDTPEVNALITEFNEVRGKALQHLHYLIVQREAMGFRRQANVQKMYKIPAKKRLMLDNDV